MITERYFSYQNINLFYRYRKGSKDTILFLHGLGDNSDSFEYVVDNNFFNDYGILLADLIGFGKSDKPSGFNYELNLQAEMLLDLINHMNINDIILIGHSFGGTLGILLSETLKNKIKSFFNCEGVLTERDLTWSRSIFSKTFDEFKKSGFDLFKQKVTSAADKYPSNLIYLKRLKKTTAEAITEYLKSS